MTATKAQPTIALTYKQVGSFEFAQTMEKLASTPTTNFNACAIRRVYKQYKKFRELIAAEFKKDIMEAYGEKNEDGTLKTTPQENMVLPDDKKEAYGKAVEEFEKRELSFETSPLRPSHISDVKLTPKELDSLGDLFTEQDGPGLPTGPGLPGNVRTLHN